MTAEERQAKLFLEGAALEFLRPCFTLAGITSAATI
jgi:hypothetical protein